MTKASEISYVETVSRVENIPSEDFISYLSRKPYSDVSAGNYLLDISQLLRFLPPPPARVLDLGAGSGWTSEIVARVGYEVVGLDVSPDMIKIARSRMREGLTLSFHVHDFEDPFSFGRFDAVILYDALHHCENERQVVENIFEVLNRGGLFLAIEPGRGHAQSKEAADAMRKYGTTEKDMPFVYVKELLVRQGFSEVKQYIRLKQAYLFNLSKPSGRFRQIAHFASLIHKTSRGLTSVVVAKK